MLFIKHFNSLFYYQKALVYDIVTGNNLHFFSPCTSWCCHRKIGEKIGRMINKMSLHGYVDLKKNNLEKLKSS